MKSPIRVSLVEDDEDVRETACAILEDLGYRIISVPHAVAALQVACEDRAIDLLFTPTTPTTAFRAGEKLEDPVQMYLADVFVAPGSLAGVPAMSIPIGRDNGLPVGGQLIAPLWGEEVMIAVAGLVEASIDATREVR